MQQMCAGYDCHWFVNDGEYNEYNEAGAHEVYQSGTNICHARNLAIRRASCLNLPCIQISDDLRNIKKIWIEDGKRKTTFIDVPFVIGMLIDEMKHHNADYGGTAISSNPLNYTDKTGNISTDKLIVNDFICVMPNTFRFDDDLALKEDYDACVIQLLQGKKIVRLNNILCDFPHRQNEGGANTYRNEITEAEATEGLMRKWPNYVIPHKTRPGQVSLDYKAIKKRLR